MRFRCELKAARCGEPQSPHLAHHRAEPRHGEPFLHRREHVGIARKLGMDHTIGVEAGLGEAGGEQITGMTAPQHRPLETRGDAGEEDGGAGLRSERRLGRRGLVQRAGGKAAAGQRGIHRRQAERQHAVRYGIGTLETGHPGARLRKPDGATRLG